MTEADMTTDRISFTHVINPFPARAGSEHDVASRITFASLRVAVEAARAGGMKVDVRAVICPGDESAVEPPVNSTRLLSRTVLDVAKLSPARPLPLIADILAAGADGVASTHLIYTNIDIGVQRDFYLQLEALIRDRFDRKTPFIVYRRNVSDRFRSPEQLPEICNDPGEVAYGHDCFVLPTEYVHALDVGISCIGAAHFDYLLSMALDRVSGFKMARVNDLALTFHIGNAISWARQLDHVEFNLEESLKAIRRMRADTTVPQDSVFATIDRNHFRPNARIDSRVLRRLKRLPGVGSVVFRLNRLLGRSH